MNIFEDKTVIEFEISETGHQIVEAKINGKLLRFILDTGAGTSVLDRGCLSELSIEETLNVENAAGLGTSDHAMGDEKGVHGLLGSPFFTQYQAVIDFSKNRLALFNKKN